MFLYGHWLKLPINTRHILAQVFGITKKSSTEVFNNEVVKDGYLIGDIESALNIDAIQKYTDSIDTDMAVLWKLMVDKVEGKITPSVEIKPIDNLEDSLGSKITINSNPESIYTTVPPKKRGRKPVEKTV